jgi:N-acetylglucosamine kinase-like BadF-type ATPase
VTEPFVLAVDIGGSGTRVARARASDPFGSSEVIHGGGVSIAASGSNAVAVLRDALARAMTTWPSLATDTAAVTVGVTGLATLVHSPGELRAHITEVVGDVPSAIVADGVCAHVGALSGAAGAVVVAGTGVIAIGTDMADMWVRSDGWGHLMGDDGGGAWIGMQALRRAASHHDGRTTGGAALLEAARGHFGAIETWPGQVYTRDDRASVLGSFAPAVAACADAGDAAALHIMRSAGRALAATLLSAMHDGVPHVGSYSGGVFGAGAHILSAFTDEWTRISSPNAELRTPAGSPLDGALRIAALNLTHPDRFRDHPPLIV